MRIAVLILGLALGAIMFVQTFLVTGFSSLAGNADSASSGSIGLLMSLLWLVAVALIFAAPLVSVIAFVLAGLLGFAMSASFPDLAYWGGASLILAALSLIEWFTKRRERRRHATEAKLEKRREAQRHSELVATAARPIVAPTVACGSCGTWNAQGTKFCSECGTSLTALPAP